MNSQTDERFVRNVTLYYIGGDGVDAPSPIAYGSGKFVVTPPIGEPFPIKFTEYEARQIMNSTCYLVGDQVVYTVTDNKAIADARKKGMSLKDVLDSIPTLTLSDDDILARIKANPKLLQKIQEMAYGEPQRTRRKSSKPKKQKPDDTNDMKEVKNV